MKELFVVESESTATSLVCIDKDTDQQFFLAVTDTVRDLLLPHHDQNTGGGVVDKPTKQQTESAHDAPHVTADTLNTEASDNSSQPTTEAVDPRLSAPLKMSPREIQARIRSGATVEQVAEDNDVPLSRIEPYAYPILSERSHIATLAQAAHPVHADKPSHLTLWEVLAAAFSARNLDIRDALWDAYRDATRQWVVQVTWKTGINEHTAEWNFMKNDSTVIPRTPLAADIIDPHFTQPVRTITSITARTEAPVADHTHDIPLVNDPSTDPTAQPTAELHGETLLQHPEPHVDNPARKRRKAVTPHWEDVLLGIRTTTKRPRQ